jgi:hypothetical protein
MCRQENCGARMCRCECHAEDPIAAVHAALGQIVADAATRFDQRPIERASVEARRELQAHSAYTDDAPAALRTAFERTLLDRMTEERNRYLAALQTIANADTFARHGAAHAQVSRVVRIARAALNGEDVA